MQHGVGACPKGQRRPERPTTAGRRRKPFLVQKVSESDFGHPLDPPSLGFIVLKIQESIWNRRLSKGSASPRATNDSWEAPEAIFFAQKVSESGFGHPLDPPSLGIIVLKIQESSWSRRLSKGSASPRATNDSWKAPEDIFWPRRSRRAAMDIDWNLKAMEVAS